MNKEKIIEILNEWNFWKQDLNAGVIRTKYLDKIFEFIASGKIISIVGVWRSGNQFSSSR